ncbi:MAG: 1-deoxy-D-xylulose-5-phosphate reductoisomerase [Epsilonproteobacteria bacterium]|nr:1-deoxy-D-xylulose-5-phosphate reductoisomerase [Campylobacterota bacterium]
MILLGSTGSIGENTLLIASKFNLKIDVLVAGKNIELLNQQIKKYNPKKVIVANFEDISRVNHPDVKAGEIAILEAIENSSSNLVVNALVGFTGLRPTLKALECGKKLALANKESLVAAGKFIDTSTVIPIDSEHFGLWYLYDKTKVIDSLVVTASGGSFRDLPLEKLKNVSIKEALNHPNWSMGNKITIDSATMTNKLFELIEARWLFDTLKCDAIIEPKSIIHALVNFKDGSTTAHIANVSMQLPIAYALLEKVEDEILEKVDLLKIKNLEFRSIETSRYPIWELKDELLKNDNLGVVINSANDFAVERFLSGKIGFLDIAKMSLNAINKFHNLHVQNIDDIFLANDEVKRYCIESKI